MSYGIYKEIERLQAEGRLAPDEQVVSVATNNGGEIIMPMHEFVQQQRRATATLVGVFVLAISMVLAAAWVLA